MSVNWVMLDGPQTFIRLPGEKIIHKSTPRITFALTTPQSYPGNNPLALHCSSGILYLTNQRIVYLPDKPTPELKSFSAPILNLHDTHLAVPWFGPNAWQAVVQPVPGGNIPATHAAVELKLTFKEGGAPDFHTTFEQIKERLQQVVSTAREANSGRDRGGLPSNLNLDTVHLDQLPSYQDSGRDRVAPDSAYTVASPTEIPSPSPVQPGANLNQDNPPPSDGPPGYEETQQQSIQAELDRRLSQAF